MCGMSEAAPIVRPGSASKQARKKVRVGVVAILALSAAPSVFAVTIDHLVYVDQYTLPHGPTSTGGTDFNNTVVGGLSGISFDTETGTYYAISDDHSKVGAEPAARFYNLSIAIGQNGFAGTNPVTINSVQSLKQPGGATFPILGVDPESIRVQGAGANKTLYWTSEGAASPKSDPPVQNPFVRQMNLEGAYVRELSTPTKFNPDSATAQTRGVRHNLGFESLTFNPTGTKAFAGTENALAQDGPPSNALHGSNSRIIRYDVATGAAEAEFVYPVDPVDPIAVAPTPAGASAAVNGLVELLALNDMEFLALERGFTPGAPGRAKTIRIFKATLTGATDVSCFDSLVGQNFAPMTKQLLITFEAGGPVNPDNIEGITLGPNLPNGHPSVLLVADNNFATTQATQFVLLSTPPSSIPTTRRGRP